MAATSTACLMVNSSAIVAAATGVIPFSAGAVILAGATGLVGLGVGGVVLVATGMISVHLNMLNAMRQVADRSHLHVY